MIQSLNGWIRALLLTVLAAGAGRTLLPEGESRKTAELLLGLLVTLALLSPLGGIGKAIEERFGALSFPDTSVSSRVRGENAAQIYADRLGEKLAEKYGLPFLGIRIECEEKGGQIGIVCAHLSFPEGVSTLSAAKLTAEVTEILSCRVDGNG